MDIQLRREETTDYIETENLTREAFWNQYIPGCDEHYLIYIMRDCPEFVHELDIVAIDDNKIVGNIAYVKAIIEGDNGKIYEVLTLGPISVLPEYQNKGIGGKMIEHTKKIASDMGYSAILLCGDPNYYSKQGFVAAEQLGIRTADNMYADALQVCELYENALSEARGRYIENSIYEVEESKAIEFDKGFPIKEKLSGTPSQKRFNELVVMRRKAI